MHSPLAISAPRPHAQRPCRAPRESLPRAPGLWTILSTNFLKIYFSFHSGPSCPTIFSKPPDPTLTLVFNLKFIKIWFHYPMNQLNLLKFSLFPFSSSFTHCKTPINFPMCYPPKHTIQSQHNISCYVQPSMQAHFTKSNHTKHTNACMQCPSFVS